MSSRLSDLLRAAVGPRGQAEPPTVGTLLSPSIAAISVSGSVSYVGCYIGPEAPPLLTNDQVGKGGIFGFLAVFLMKKSLIFL